MLNTKPKIQEIYQKVIENLSPNEQIGLASLILNNLAQKNIIMIDDSDTWTIFIFKSGFRLIVVL